MLFRLKKLAYKIRTILSGKTKKKDYFVWFSDALNIKNPDKFLTRNQMLPDFECSFFRSSHYKML
jgi:hypothetical protein